MRPSTIYDEIVRSMPAGLERAVLSVLRFHVGEINHHGKQNLIHDLERMGFGRGQPWSTVERQVREVIGKLRDQGIPVCSSSGEGGYFIASCWDEFDRFIGQEIDARIVSLGERKAAMMKAASDYIGPRPVPAGQGSLW